MKTVSKRLQNLEEKFGVSEKPQLLFVLRLSANRDALDSKTCSQILREGGFLTPRPPGLLNLLDLPAGLNPEETKRYLLENGDKICGRTPRGPNFA